MADAFRVEEEASMSADGRGKGTTSPISAMITITTAKIVRGLADYARAEFDNSRKSTRTR